MTAPVAADPVNTVTLPQAVFKDSMQHLDNNSGMVCLIYREVRTSSRLGIQSLKLKPPTMKHNNYLCHLQIKTASFFRAVTKALTAPRFSTAWSEDSQKVWVPKEDTNLEGFGGEALCSDRSPDGEGQSSKASVFIHPSPVSGDSHPFTGNTGLTKDPLWYITVFFLTVSSGGTRQSHK